MLLFHTYIALCVAVGVETYSNFLYKLVDDKVNFTVSNCGSYNYLQSLTKIDKIQKLYGEADEFSHDANQLNTLDDIDIPMEAAEVDPLNKFERTLNGVLFGRKNYNKGEFDHQIVNYSDGDPLAHIVAGNVMRSEIFQNRSGVHLPMPSWQHRGHAYLNVSSGDIMQIAVNAFSIFLEGTLEDVMRLPSMYVLKSARTISMMKIAREKVVATWDVVKDGCMTEEVTYQMLEYFRPLFKYISGGEMAKLNLKDERILSYIGTHADLDRHQVGVVASSYINLNPNWRVPSYLNLMNNLLCGVPMKFMRRIHENVYLQLSHQLFYHIRACDPLQRRFYLAMMTRTQVLGKSNSWNARDVARLGLLLTEVDGPELNAISPEAMIGITTQVMVEMSAENLQYLTQTQVQYLSQKALNIYIKKINAYKDKQMILSGVRKTTASLFVLIITLIIGLIKEHVF